MRTLILLLGLTILSAGSTFGQTGKELPFQTWALTPPMGWNSWDCFGPTVVEEEVKQNADYMAEHLSAYGWEYVVVDIRWFVENDKAGGYNQTNPIYVYDEYGRYTPALNRFPSAANGVGFKSLADYVHEKGLKFGIHLMRGLPKVAAEKKLPVKGTNGITCDMIANNDSACTWLRDNYKVDCTKPGAQEYYNSCFELYAEWGVDFVKIDDLSRPYHTGEIEMIRKAIDHCGRPIVLSISPGETPLTQTEHVKKHANMWRTVDDFWDNWSQLNYQFEVCAKWAPYIAPGTWPDADMLPLGKISIRGERGAERWTNFTRDEQYTMMNLWCIFKSPLMFGGHLPENDAATDSLLTNKDVLYMHHYSANNREVSNIDNKVIWSADDPANGDKFAALFNLGGTEFVSTKKALWRSGTISYLTTGYMTEAEVEIPQGSRELALIVTDGGDGYDSDHADWINPTVILADGSTIKLTEKTFLRSTCGWGSIAINKNLNGGNLSVNGKTYSNGFATHANSIMLFALPEEAVKFTAMCGIDNTGSDQGSKSSVEFMVFAEDPTIREEVTDGNAGSITLKVDPGKQVASSGLISRAANRQSTSLEANIAGAEKLYLVVTNGGDGLSYDHADWLNPVLVDKEGNEVSLTSIGWDSNPVNGWTTPKLNKNNDGNTLTVEGIAYDKGFGVNAPSMLTFTLPEGHEYVTFKTTVGFDDDVKNAASGATMEFRVFTQDPAPDQSAPCPLDLTSLGFAAEQPCKITEMWSGKEEGIFKADEFVPVLRSHASGLYRITPLERSEEASVSLSVSKDGEGKFVSGTPFEVVISVSGRTEESKDYIQLLANGKVIGTLPVSSDGTATYTANFPYGGNYVLQAKYSGTLTIASAISEEVILEIEGAEEDLSLLRNRLQGLIDDASGIDLTTVAGAMRIPLEEAIEYATSALGKDKVAMETAISQLSDAMDAARLTMSSMKELKTALNTATDFLTGIAEGEEKTLFAEEIQKAEEVYTSSFSTVDEVKAATTDLSNSMQQAKKTTLPANGKCFDMTEFLVNPSFENKTTGWNVFKQTSGWESFDTWSDRPAADGTYFVSLCYGNITSIDLYQTVASLPAGFYTLEGALRNTDGISFLTDQRLYAQAGGEIYNSEKLTKVSGTGNNTWFPFTVSDIFLPEGESLRIGVRSSGTGSGTKGWFQADDFRLYYWGKESTNIHSAFAENNKEIHITAHAGGISIQANKKCILPIYTLNGTLVKNADLKTGKQFLALPAGTYIIANQIVWVY